MDMALRINTDYFYRSEAGQFSFIKIPKLLVTGEDFSSLSISAKILYGLLLDRMAIASKNQWIDDEGRVYIQYQLSEIQEDMNISKRKAGECLNELQDMGLILKRKGGNGYPSRIYAKIATLLRKGGYRFER